MNLSNFDLPFSTENAVEISGGSRSRGYRIGNRIVRIPLRDDSLMEQKRESEISALMQKYLPDCLKSKVTNIQFNDKCSYHQAIKGSLLENFNEKTNAYDSMNPEQRHQLAVDIAELLAAIHQIPIHKAQAITQKYAKACRNENKTELADFDYTSAKENILDASNGKINLDTFKTAIPTDGLALCHNDLHAGNMIIKDNRLNGFIDFGEAGINPRINDFFHLYRLDRNLAVDVIKEYNKISDYKIDIKVADYQFLSNTGYTLEKRKNQPLFELEVVKVLKKFISSYQK
ncbi:MAG: phosphotransferase [Alphaproteobacteria bacterium]|nr:phosphotransferase [Alphaproteobacteria bacterium]